MFDHRNAAVEGLYPGLISHKSIANLGLFDLEVIITPVLPVSGGGGYVRNAPSDKYTITIRVTRKGRLWEQTYVANKTLARVVAKLARVEINNPEVSINSVKKVD